MNKYKIKKMLDVHSIQYFLDNELNIFLCYVYAFSNDYDIIYYDDEKLSFIIEDVNGVKKICNKNNFFAWLGY